MPVTWWIRRRLEPWIGTAQRPGRPLPELVWRGAETLTLATVLLVSCGLLAAGTYNPFIYFRF